MAPQTNSNFQKIKLNQASDLLQFMQAQQIIQEKDLEQEQDHIYFLEKTLKSLKQNVSLLRSLRNEKIRGDSRSKHLNSVRSKDQDNGYIRNWQYKDQTFSPALSKYQIGGISVQPSDGYFKDLYLKQDYDIAKEFSFDQNQGQSQTKQKTIKKQRNYSVESQRIHSDQNIDSKNSYIYAHLSHRRPHFDSQEKLHSMQNV